MEERQAASRGFTIVEFVLVLLTMAVLAAIAAPRYSASLSRYRVESAAHRLATDIAMCQKAARAASASRTLVFGDSPGSYTISGVNDPTNRSNPYTVFLGNPPYGVAVASVTFTDAVSDNTLAFSGYGVPDSGMSVVIRSGPFQRTVTLSASGSVGVN